MVELLTSSSNFFFFFHLDIDGQVGMKLTCGTIVAEEKDRVEKEDKVINFFIHYFYILFVFGSLGLFLMCA